MTLFQGIYTPIVTPYHLDNRIDYEALAKLIDYLIDCGINGIIVAGTTGEYYAHSQKERLQLISFCQKTINNRLPMIVGTGSMNTDESIIYAKAAAKVGADGLLIATPPYAMPTDKENALHALAIDNAANLPVMLYNYPARMGVTMGRAFLDRVCRSANFQAIKESSGDINRIHLLAQHYAHIQLGCGMDDQALEFYAWGASCWVCAGSNFAAKAHIALDKACRLEGDFIKGRAIMMAMLPLMHYLEQGGKFIQSIKYGLTLRGIPVGMPRKPLKPLNKDEKRQLKQIITTMDSAIDYILESL